MEENIFVLNFLLLQIRTRLKTYRSERELMLKRTSEIPRLLSHVELIKSRKKENKTNAKNDK